MIIYRCDLKIITNIVIISKKIRRHVQLLKTETEQSQNYKS